MVLDTRAGGWIAIVALLLAGALLAGPGALAVHDNGLFELDGNVADAPGGGTDWDALFDASGNPTGVSVIASAFVDDTLLPGSTADSTTHKTDNKDTLEISGGGWNCNQDNNVADKVDILNAYSAVFKDAGGNLILYFGVERDSNQGDAAMGAWFFQNDVGCVSPGPAVPFSGSHAFGDLLVISDFSNGGTISNISVYRWNTSAPNNLELVFSGADCGPPAAPSHVDVCGKVNTGNVQTPWSPSDSPGTALEPRTFLEAGVNLTKIFGLNDLPCFSSFLAETRTSTSLTSSLHDFAAGDFRVCDAHINITPAFAINDVGTTHTLTITVTKSEAGPFVPAVGVTVFANITSGPGNFEGDGTETTCVTNSTGQCDVVITSDISGTTVVTAEVNVQIGNDVLHRSTNGMDGNSGPAQKQWNPVNPGVTTTADPTGGDVVPGTGVRDTATVTGAAGLPDPTGTVTFFLCQPSEVTDAGCPAPNGSQVGGAVALTAGTATSDYSFNTATIGTYCWRAEYSGDGTYLPGSHTNNSTECFTIAQQPSDTTTTPSSASISLGETVADSVTVTGGIGTPTGTVDFYICSPSELTGGVCSAGGTFVSTETLVGGAATSDDYTPDVAGTWCWRGVYSGDTAYLGSTDATEGECFTVLAPDVSVVKTAADDVISAGEDAVFTITVTNSGAGDAFDVVITDQLPGDIAWVEDPDTLCTISATQFLECDVGTLAAGASFSVTVRGTTDAPDCGVLENTATVDASNDEPVSSSATITVQCPDLVIV
ncbi:MAG TPA: Ig-like domain repeat protein, partial [Candidatus Thermoplasmatota archaeon]|nr:Ig-like domain repeat protein [Candidatus Thermoplasmatota archaeon]